MAYRIRTLVTVAVLLSLVAALGVAVDAQRGPSPASLLRAAIDKEVVEGDVAGALRDYQQLVERFAGTDRPVAATALLQIGTLYVRFGTGDPAAVLARLTREFGDQPAVLSLARSRLARNSAQAASENPRVVWTVPGGDAPPAGRLGRISQDGRLVAYSDTEQTEGDLFVHDLTNGTDRRITTKNAEEITADGVFSRDGRYVAYTWVSLPEDRAELRISDVAGAPEPRRLLVDPSVQWVTPYDWSPDGASVVVEIARHAGHELALVSATDGAVISLRPVARGSGGINAAFFSPDGGYLAYGLSVATPRGPRSI
jgi:roadblock/LC7 domain-containing protein